jgi:hypothetical protein
MGIVVRTHVNVDTVVVQHAVGDADETGLFDDAD